MQAASCKTPAGDGKTKATDGEAEGHAEISARAATAASKQVPAGGQGKGSLKAGTKVAEAQLLAEQSQRDAREAKLAAKYGNWDNQKEKDAQIARMADEAQALITEAARQKEATKQAEAETERVRAEMAAMQQTIEAAQKTWQKMMERSVSSSSPAKKRQRGEEHGSDESEPRGGTSTPLITPVVVGGTPWRVAMGVSANATSFSGDEEDRKPTKG